MPVKPLFVVLVLALHAQAIAQPLGLPAPVREPADARQPHKIALGKRLFFDQRLSGDGSISCASCHRPERAFSDGLAQAQGIGRQAGTRNTPSLLNVRFNSSQFWDGRSASLEAQALLPFLDPREHGLADARALIAALNDTPGYAAAFRARSEERR